jgi:tripartite-type tricarboxylate transporter receptor subunit TctC
MVMQTLRAVLRFAAAVGLSTVAWGSTLSAARSQALHWPQRPVKFIAPLGPGAEVDIGARFQSDRLPARWGEPVSSYAILRLQIDAGRIKAPAVLPRPRWR